VVVTAQEEARLLKHDYIGTEHILLGLLDVPDSVAVKVLHQLGYNMLEPEPKDEGGSAESKVAKVVRTVLAPRLRRRTG
jgi:ATP-dependent Clp protease ATP-binding subunit ClpA